MTENDQEVWVRSVVSTAPDMETWHLHAGLTEEFPERPTDAHRRPTTVCGVTLDGVTETHEGLPGHANACMPCYQVHLARLGIDLDDAPLGEDYEPLSMDPAQARTVSGDVEGGTMMALHPRSSFDRIVEAGLEPFQITPTRDGEECPACFEPLRVEQYATMVPLGPGGDEEERAKAADGRPYNAVAARVHWGCATGLPDALAQGFIETKQQREEGDD